MVKDISGAGGREWAPGHALKLDPRRVTGYASRVPGNLYAMIEPQTGQYSAGPACSCRCNGTGVPYA